MSDQSIAALSKIALTLGLLALGIYLWANAYFALYGWFLLPIGAPAIGMAHAYGLAITVRAVAHTSQYAKTDESKFSVAQMVNGMVLYPLTMIAVGYIIVHWIGI